MNCLFNIDLLILPWQIGVMEENREHAAASNCSPDLCSLDQWEHLDMYNKNDITQLQESTVDIQQS